MGGPWVSHRLVRGVRNGAEPRAQAPLPPVKRKPPPTKAAQKLCPQEVGEGGGGGRGWGRFHPAGPCGERVIGLRSGVQARDQGSEPMGWRPCEGTGPSPR